MFLFYFSELYLSDASEREQKDYNSSWTQSKSKSIMIFCKGFKLEKLVIR